MTRNKAYLITQTVLCILLAALLSAGAVGIYREGAKRKAEGHAMEWIYTREKAADTFGRIEPLFFAAIGLMAAGLILNVRDEKEDQPVRDTELARNLITARVSVPDEAMKKERDLQKKLRAGGAAAAAVCAVPVLAYMLTPSHFAYDDLERMAGSLVMHILPWTLLGLAALAVSTVLQEKSMLRETEAAKKRIAEEKAAGIRPEEAPAGEEKTGTGLSRLRAVLFAAAVCFIIAGIFNGSMRDVLYKAVKICTECVGLG